MVGPGFVYHRVVALKPSRPWALFVTLLLGAGLIMWLQQRPGSVETVTPPSTNATSGVQVSSTHPRNDMSNALAAFLESEGFRFDAAKQGGQWQAERDGRTWILSVNPQRRTRYYGELKVREWVGQHLRISATTGVQAKLYAVSNGFTGNWVVRWIYRLRGLTVLNASSSHSVVTDSPEWTSRMMSRTGFARHTQWMQDVPDASKRLGSFHVLAGQGHFSNPVLNPSQLTPSFVRELLTRIETVLREAEAVPAHAPNV